MAPALVDSSSISVAHATQKPTIKTPLPNPSLQVTADHNLKLQEAPVYAPAKGEVLLHIKATGVCG
jgi:L-iditol 2-dehydrogenase